MTPNDDKEHTTALVTVEAGDLTMARAPQVVLEEARQAARALKDVIDSKPKKVTINNKVYLEIEDWITLGRFYGVTAKVLSTTPVTFGEAIGFECHAAAIRSVDGMELSAADSMCLNDEARWRDRPLFQLRSMAQTRACAKALSQVLRWVPVLAGYAGTPAEEMTGTEREHAGEWTHERSAPAPAPAKGRREGTPISEAQRRRLFAKCKSAGLDPTDVAAWLKRDYGYDKEHPIARQDYDTICGVIDSGTLPPASLPPTDDDAPTFEDEEHVHG